MYNPALSCYIQ